MEGGGLPGSCGPVAVPDNNSPPSPKDGPVLTMMNKRLRALKKKLNRIAQIEQSRDSGKLINKEQAAVLESKPSVVILIDEYEKLRQALLDAVKEELEEHTKELALAAAAGKTMPSPESAEENPTHANEEEDEEADVKEANSDGKQCPLETLTNPDGDEKDVVVQFANEEKPADNSTIAELLKVLYFSHLFDLRPQAEGGAASASLMWTKAHERSSCLSYDFVTEDDSVTPLLEADLDGLALVGSLLTSRPPNTTLSHQDALQQCTHHALQWLRNSDCTIDSNLGFSYSHLRERLNRIVSSKYFTMTPELQTVNQQEEAAAAVVGTVGQYETRALVDETSERTDVLGAEASTFYSHQDDGSQAVEGSIHVTGSDNTETCESSKESPTYTQSQAYVEMKQVSSAEDDNSDEAVAAAAAARQDTVSEQQQHGAASSQPQSHVSHVNVGPRGYQGSRSGRGGGYATGGRGRGTGSGYMTNGRGRGRPGASYSRGREGQNYDQGGYYQRSYSNGRGGRGGRGGGMMYNEYSHVSSNAAPQSA